MTRCVAVGFAWLAGDKRNKSKIEFGFIGMDRGKKRERVVGGGKVKRRVREFTLGDEGKE